MICVDSWEWNHPRSSTHFSIPSLLHTLQHPFAPPHTSASLRFSTHFSTPSLLHTLQHPFAPPHTSAFTVKLTLSFPVLLSSGHHSSVSPSVPPPDPATSQYWPPPPPMPAHVKSSVFKLSLCLEIETRGGYMRSYHTSACGQVLKTRKPHIWKSVTLASLLPLESQPLG